MHVEVMMRSLFLSVTVFINLIGKSDSAIPVVRCLPADRPEVIYLACYNQLIQIITARYGLSYWDDAVCHPYSPTPDDCTFGDKDLTMYLRGECNMADGPCRPSISFPNGPDRNECSDFTGISYIQLQYACVSNPPAGNSLFLMEGGVREFRGGNNEIIQLTTAHYPQLTSVYETSCVLRFDRRVKVKVDIKDLSYQGSSESTPFCLTWQPHGIDTCANKTSLEPQFTLIYPTLLTVKVLTNETFEGRYWIHLTVKLDGEMWSTPEPTLEIRCEGSEEATTQAQAVTTIDYNLVQLVVHPMSLGIHEYGPADIIHLKSMDYPEMAEITRGARCQLFFPSDVHVLMEVHQFHQMDDSPESALCLQWGPDNNRTCAHNTVAEFQPQMFETPTTVYLTLNNLTSLQGRFFITLKAVMPGSETTPSDPSLEMECEDVKPGASDLNVLPDDDAESGTDWTPLIILIIAIIVVIIIVILIIILGAKMRNKNQKSKGPPSGDKGEKEKETVGILTLKRLNSAEDEPNYGTSPQASAPPMRNSSDGYGDYDNLPPMKSATAPAQQMESCDYDVPIPYSGHDNSAMMGHTNVADPRYQAPSHPPSYGVAEYDYDYLPTNQGDTMQSTGSRNPLVQNGDYQ